MKKITLLSAMMICGTIMFAQMSPRSASDGNNVFTGSRDAIFECAPGFVFSQFDPAFTNAYFCDVNYGWTKAMDDYTATGPFSTIRFWGFNLFGCAPGTSQTFLIEIYNGDPSSGGTVVNSFTKTATPQPKGVFVPWSGFQTEMYQVDIDLGTIVTQLNGWVSISRTSSTDGCNFAWTAKDGAGNSMSWGPDYGYTGTGAALYFCLGGGGVVPVSNWALIIGIALIATVALIRIRRS